MDYISITKYWRYQIKFNLSETFEEYYFKLIKKNKQLFIQMFELPDELWNHIKEYQLDWKKKHKKKKTNKQKIIRIIIRRKRETKTKTNNKKNKHN